MDAARRTITDPDDPLGEFERLGDWYYADTGFLRPGTSEPMECGGYSNSNEDRERFSKWWDEKRREAIRDFECRERLSKDAFAALESLYDN